MKKILLKIAIAALMCCVAIGGNAYPISQETALQLVKTNRTLNNLSNSDVRFYVAATDTIINNYCCRVQSLPIDTWANGASPMWLIFVDEHPKNHLWSHPCKYYYVPQQYISVTDIPILSYDGEFFPNNITVESESSERIIARTINKDSLDRIFSNPPIDSAYTIPVINQTQPRLHVVIIAGGYRKTPANSLDINNMVPFYNDTKYLYQVLRNKYRIPKSDIHILLASGGKYSDEFLVCDTVVDGSDYISIAQTSPDLDGDSIPDVEGASNIVSYNNLMDSLADVIDEKDHLLIVFNVHGGVMPNKSGCKFLLWEEIYDTDYEGLTLDNILSDSELCDKLDAIQCASQCVVLGSCHSGLAIPNLRAPNRVILTATDDKPTYMDDEFGIFMHKWTNAINGSQFLNSHNYYTTSDTNNNGWVSMDEVREYVGKFETYKNPDEDQSIYIEAWDDGLFNPQYSSMCTSLGEDWAINHLPDPTALYIRDSNKQNDNGLDGYCDQTYVGYNASPDIVVSPIDNEPGKLAIKVTIRNRGYKQYDGTGRYLHLHWKPSTYSDDRSNWIGRVTNLMKNAPEFAILQIEDSIGSGGETTVETIWNLPPRLLDAEGAYNNTQFDILARVSDSSQPVINDHTGLLYPFKYNNLDDVIYAGNMATCRPNINKVTNLPVDCQLSVLAGPDGNAVLHVMADSIASGLSLSLSLSSQLALAATGEASPTLMQVEAGDSIIFSGLTPNAEYSIPVTCAVNSLQVTSATTAVIPLTITTTDGVVNEAAMMQVTIAPRNNTINPEIGEVIGEIDPGNDWGGGVITGEIEPGDGSDLGGGEIGGLNDTGRCLMMTNVSEPVSCQWTDAAGTVLGTADTLVIPDNASGDYTLTVTALSDNATASVTRTLRPISAIWNLSANGGDITVTLRRKACQGTTITVQPAIGTEQARTFQVEQGTKTVTLYSNDMASGQYMVSLYVNNILKETKQIIK